MAERLVLCGGASGTTDGSTLRLALDGRRRLTTNLPDLLVDLIEIATYVFCADQGTSRGGAAWTGVGERWRRSFRFVIPVRCPECWNDNRILNSLTAALSILSEDEYAFEFEKANNPTPLHRYFELDAEGRSGFMPDHVVLFSGGLDSLGGTLEELVDSENHIALVSHKSSSKIFARQTYLVGEIKKRFPKRIMHIPVQVVVHDTLRIQDYNQRSRSFLYASLACVVARLFEITQVRFFENGVISINLPISAQLVGARASRTTHPLVLQKFREFFPAVAGAPIEYRDRFAWKTKADVVRSILDRDGGPLIEHTVSCTRSYEITRAHTHCGRCSQCIDRRFAVLAACAGQNDSVNKYKIELLTGVRDGPYD